MQLKELRQSFAVTYDYSVYFADGVFTPDNPLLRDVLSRAGEGPHRLMIVLDSGVAEHHPRLGDQIQAYCEHHADAIALSGEPLIVKGGEVCKLAPLEVQQFYDKVAEEAICRHSFVLVIGGGAVLDAMGFAAATAHRGVKLIRMPSTVLAQNDAGVGVKNAINHGQRKNFVGTFAPPYAVINDVQLLSTLDPRDQRAGISEAVKVALVKDAEFFQYLYRSRHALGQFQPIAMQHMIQRCAELHLAHIANNGDPFEQGSARPLDFGHWAAHKLEELTHAAVRHGEAVAIGVMLDSLYSWRLGQLSDNDIAAIYATLTDMGFAVYHYEMAAMDVAGALEEFRAHLGGELCITLLDDIGVGREYATIDTDLMQACVDDLARLHAGEAQSVFASSAQLELSLAV